MINASVPETLPEETSLGPAPVLPEPPEGPARRVLSALRAHRAPATIRELTGQLGGHPNTVRLHLQRLVQEGWVLEQTLPAQGRGRPARVYAVSPQAPATAADPVAEEYLGLATAFAAHLSRGQAPAEEARQVGRLWGRSLSARRSDAARADRPREIVASGPHPEVVASGPHPEVVAPSPHPEVVGVDPRAEVFGVDPQAEVVGVDPQAEVVGVDPRAEVVGMLEGLGFSPLDDGPERPVLLRTCPLLTAAKANPEVICTVHLGLVEGALEAAGGSAEGVSLVSFAAPGSCHLRIPAQP